MSTTTSVEERVLCVIYEYSSSVILKLSCLMLKPFLQGFIIRLELCSNFNFYLIVAVHISPDVDALVDSQKISKFQLDAHDCKGGAGKKAWKQYNSPKRTA